MCEFGVQLNSSNAGKQLIRFCNNRFRSTSVDRQLSSFMALSVKHIRRITEKEKETKQNEMKWNGRKTATTLNWIKSNWLKSVKIAKYLTMCALIVECWTANISVILIMCFHCNGVQCLAMNRLSQLMKKNVRENICNLYYECVKHI